MFGSFCIAMPQTWKKSNEWQRFARVHVSCCDTHAHMFRSTHCWTTACFAWAATLILPKHDDSPAPAPNSSPRKSSAALCLFLLPAHVNSANKVSAKRSLRQTLHTCKDCMMALANGHVHRLKCNSRYARAHTCIHTSAHLHTHKHTHTNMHALIHTY